MTTSPTKADPRVRAACEEALAYTGPRDTLDISVSSLAENVTRGLRVAKKAMSDSQDVSVIARRELFLAAMGARGSGRLAPGVVRRLVDNLETALLNALAPDETDEPPTTPTLGFDKFRLSPTEGYVKALEEAMLRGLGPQARPRIEYRPLSGGVHFDGGDAVDLETRWMRNTWTGVRRDGDPVDLERLERLDMNPPGLGALDRLMRDEWATVVDARKNGLAVEGTRENGLAVSGTNETGPFDRYKRTEA